MSYYQLRLPEELSLERLLRRTASEMIGILALAGLGWAGGIEAAERELRKVFDKHLSSYDTCGCSSICDEQASPADENPGADSRLVSTAPEDRLKVQRFHLRIFHGALDELAQATARFAIHMSGNQLSPEAHAAEKALSQAFFASLAPYLFKSQLCQHLELCRSAQPTDVWNGQALLPSA